MSTRFDACSPRPKKDGGTFWVRVGTAFQGERGTQIILDALPIPDAEGRVVISLFEPRDNNAGAGRGQRADTRQPAPALDDDIPGF